MADKIQVRRGTTTQWSSANPVLSEGEIGLNTSISQFKIGNGITPWSSLVYYPSISSVALQIQDAINALVGGSPTALDTLSEIAAAINNDPQFFSHVLPLQLGNSGKFLTTNGTTASWEEIPESTPHPFSMMG